MRVGNGQSGQCSEFVLGESGQFLGNNWLKRNALDIRSLSFNGAV